MREFLEPLFIKIMDAITPETLSDWSTCMSEISVRERIAKLQTCHVSVIPFLHDYLVSFTTMLYWSIFLMLFALG